MIPPMLMKLRLKEEGKRGIRLWLPLILLWPVALLVFLLVLPFLVLVSVFHSKSRRMIIALPSLYRMICSLRGLRVEVEDTEEEVFVEFA